MNNRLAPWVVGAAVVFSLMNVKGCEVPDPVPPPDPKPVPVATVAHDFFVAYSRLMADYVWDEAAAKAERGEFPDILAAHQWITERADAARKAARHPVHEMEESLLDEKNPDWTKAAEVWRMFAEDARRVE